MWKYVFYMKKNPAIELHQKTLSAHNSKTDLLKRNGNNTVFKIMRMSSGFTLAHK